MDSYYIGIDIGGSHVGLGLLNSDSLELSNEYEVFLENSILQESLIDLLYTEIVKLAGQVSSCTILGIGIGCPGQCKNGVLVAAANFQYLSNCPICKLLRDKISGNSIFSGHCNIVLLNDADAAISAEVWGKHTAEKYQNYQNIAMITLGTGIGLGLVLNSNLYQGSNGLVEGGHMIIDTNKQTSRKCGCGQYGCVEAYASATNTAKIYDETSNTNVFVKTLSLGMLSSPSKKPSDGAKGVFDMASEGDVIAQQVLKSTYENLAYLCINICRIIDPDIIIFGGGMSKGKGLIENVKMCINEKSWTVLPTFVQLETANLLNNSGILGAALAAKNMTNYKVVDEMSEQHSGNNKSGNTIAANPVVQTGMQVLVTGALCFVLGAISGGLKGYIL